MGRACDAVKSVHLVGKPFLQRPPLRLPAVVLRV